MVKYLEGSELEKIRDEERREYFRYMNKLRKHQKNMLIAFTTTMIACVLIVSGVLLYAHYNNQTLVLVLVRPSESNTEEVAKKILINEHKKLKFDASGNAMIKLQDLYDNKYSVKLDKLYQNDKLCNGYILITKTEKYYQIDTTNYCN